MYNDIPLTSTVADKLLQMENKYISPVGLIELTHWGRVTHICVSKLSIIGSDNGLSPDWRQAIIWTNAGILLIGTLGTNFNEILIEIHIFSFKNIDLKMSSAKWRLFSLGLNVLTRYGLVSPYGPGIGLFLGGTKKLTEPTLTSNKWNSVTFTYQKFHTESPSYYMYFL